jgi:hypothetical protein
MDSVLEQLIKKHVKLKNLSYKRDRKMKKETTVSQIVAEKV